MTQELSPPRYYLIACGTQDYDADPGSQLDIRADLNRVSKVLCEKFGYQRELEDVSLNPNRDFPKALADWLNSDERTLSDHLIVYYSGHGVYLSEDKHYLILKETDPDTLPQTSLATLELFQPLQNEKVRLAQALFIIDTCFSSEGAGDLARFGSAIISSWFSGAKGAFALHTIAACRGKQYAENGAFSSAFDHILSNWNEFPDSGHIAPDHLVEKINERLQSLEVRDQNVQHRSLVSEGRACFFPIVPQHQKLWDEQREVYIQQLREILRQDFEATQFAINTYLLAQRQTFAFITDYKSLRKFLDSISQQPVLDEICPLLSCVTWCLAVMKPAAETAILPQLQTWQEDVLQLRTEANSLKIGQEIQQTLQDLKEVLSREKVRLTAVLAPEEDPNNSGELKGCFVLKLSLWVSCCERQPTKPLKTIAENIQVSLPDEEECDASNLEGLLECLQKKANLAQLIREFRSSFTIFFGIDINLMIEFFLPLEFYNTPFERVSFKRGRREVNLGQEYPMILNSYERYFDEDFVYEILPRVNRQKECLWPSDQSLASDDPILCPDFDEMDGESGQFLCCGTAPSRKALEQIEEAFPIAVWGRDKTRPFILDTHLKLEQWREWPHELKNYRDQLIETIPITLFWDDKFPKPSKLTPFDTSVVN